MTPSLAATLAPKLNFETSGGPNMLKLALVFSFFAVNLFIPDMAQASFSRCKIRNNCDDEPVGSSCTIPGGIGRMAFASSGWNSSRGSYCAVTRCNEGYQQNGSLCQPIIRKISCNVPNGAGEADSYGGQWSSCEAKSCHKGFSLVRGVCRAANIRTPTSVAKACSVYGGRGQYRVVNANNKYCHVLACNKGFTQRGQTCVRPDAPVAKINLVIIKRANGTGNEKWTRPYIYRMIDQMTAATQGNIKFYLGRVTIVKDNGDFNANTQDEVKMKYIKFREFGAITAVATQPFTTDSAGTALGIKYNAEPIMMFRSRSNDGSENDSSVAGAVLLHEMGHNMGMKHNYDNAVHMDNHYYKTPGIIRDYVRNLNGCRVPSVACVQNYNKFGNYIGISNF